jgi:predicted secreted protein
MSLLTSISVFMVIWWTVLFAVLPIGSRSYHEMGIKPPGGGDPGAPVNPNLKRKFFTTTWIAGVVFAMLWVIVRFQLITLPPMHSNY